MLDGPVAARLGYSCPALADWTGNGRLDLIVGGAGGEVLFLRNDGGPTDAPVRHAGPVPLRGRPADHPAPRPPGRRRLERRRASST